MAPLRVFALTAAAMIAFAANSLLCRLALRDTSIDPASFTSLRVISGALMLWLLVRLQQPRGLSPAGSWRSAFALFAYAAAFSFAYVSLSAGTGALLLFGAVDVAGAGVAPAGEQRSHCGTAFEPHLVHTFLPISCCDRITAAMRSAPKACCTARSAAAATSSGATTR